MHRGELLTRLTIWLALGAYAIGEAAMLSGGCDGKWRRVARLAWTCGCLFFLTHVACAFSYYHHWSHAAAYAETASRTGELTGWRWGGGLYFNYVFAAVWLGDVLWWWAAPGSFAQRSELLNAAWHGFFFFMVLNGAVVFGHGPVRWFGGAICVGLTGLMGLWRRRRWSRNARRGIA